MKRNKSKKPIKLPESAESKSQNKSRPTAFKKPIASQTSRTSQIVVVSALIALILIIYLPVRNYGFVDLDDPQYVSENPHVANGLTWEGISWGFTSIYASYWIPLIWVSHMLDIQLYGLKAGGHHVTNVVLHIANAILLFALLQRMTGALGRSAFVAGLFAVHPLHVESVVWITERKDVLSTLFWLLTMWAYVSYVRRPSARRYLLIIGFFVLGLMAKPMLVTLPFALLLMDIWPLNRLTLAWPLTLSQRSVAMRLIREKLPLLGLAAILSIITYLAQKLTGAVVDITHVSLPFRLGNALLSYAIYIRQMFWPTRLALFYPYPESLVAWQVLASAVMLIVVTGLAVGSARKRPYFLVGWLWYLGTLVPVIGFIQAGDQAHADRFMYVPIIGLFIIIAWAIPEISERNRVFAAVAGASALIAICTVVARIQVGHWQSKISIWEHALAVADESYIAHTNLGIALYETGKLDESIQHYQSALRVRPDFAEAHNDLGVALADKGQIDGAINEFLAGLRAKPKQAASHYNVAVLLESRGNIPTAIEHLEAALRLEPGYVDARRELDKLRGANANRR